MVKSDSGNWHLSFSIGPVQGFVAQARRTRDFWCGSWLLSYLSENALAAAEKCGGKTLIPYRKPGDVGAVTSIHSAVGGIPNRFELTFESELLAVDAGKHAQSAFHEAWRSIANEVWETFVAKFSVNNPVTADIWRRQVNEFWEINWVVGELDARHQPINALSAARKNFRNVVAHPEPGVKCTLMPNYQELSGNTNRTDMDQFWNALKKEVGKLEFRRGERLCAVALIKRLYPKVSKQVIGVDLEKNNWPSTAFMAAIPWLKSLNGEAKTLAQQYVVHAEKACIGRGDSNAAREVGVPWASIDAPAWYANGLEANDWDVAEDSLVKLKKNLQQVYQAAAETNRTQSRPTPYYALLMMDGDHMGRLLQELGDPSELSNCLGDFTTRVDGIVTADGGKTIYAGGDDVMAIVPGKNALHIAKKLSAQYRDSFMKDGTPIQSATISAAIVYAHWTYPLRHVLGHGHQLLDQVAKNASGRDSLAVGIVQGSGLNVVWSAPWKVVLGEESGFTALEDLMFQFGSVDSDPDEPLFNASFLYHLREQFSRLFANSVESPGSYGAVEIDSDDVNILAALANAELRRRLKAENRKFMPPEVTLDRLQPLMRLSQRTKNNNGVVEAERNSFGFDGWRVARFLKQIHDGKVGSHE